MNLIFDASAGTGKTWQVTGLYSALVLGSDHPCLPPGRRPVPPERILLMTFTDNAAAELRGRVSEKMIAAEQAALERGDDEQADRARRVLRSLPAAQISTIHAFCAGLIREHALELGCSPAVQTLEEESRDELLDEVLKEQIFQALDSDPDFREFCAGLSILGDNEHSLIRTIRSLLGKAASRGLDLNRAEEMLPPPDLSVTLQDFERIRDELADSGLTQKTVLEGLDALNTFLGQFPDGIEELKKFGRVQAVQHLSDELFEFKERFVNETRYAEHRAKFQAFARCLAACARRFAEAKRAHDTVDFDDQLLRARDLLQSGMTDAPLFDWIVVDEVQDTSRVQCEVIQALWTRETRLVICGDRKQSIYAWRSADPQVMPDLEKEMERRGGLRRITLSKSFRSKDLILEAVNGLFRRIYGTEYDHAELEPAAELNARTSAEGEGPCVEFLMPDHEERTVEEEMAAVARRIRLLTCGDGFWRPKFRHNGAGFATDNEFKYSDILILLKRSTRQPALEKALRAQGIPFNSGGKGQALFDQQEVRDLLLFLQALVQPFNDVALAGFLRSPFAGLSDDQIIRLGWDGETFGRHALRRNFFEKAEEGAPLAAAERLLRYRAQTGEKLPSQLVREAVRETAFDAQLAGSPDGEQKLANLKKAIDWLREAERGGQTLPGEVVRRFEGYIRRPPRSGAAEALLPDPDQNAVTIMTVHGAKGLTKRVCFVPDISFREVNEPGFAMISSAGTLELKWNSPAEGEARTPGWESARETEKGIRAVERINTFYVAMTRARDLVVLSGAGTKKPEGWLSDAEAFLSEASSGVLRKVPFSDLPAVEEEAPLDGGGDRPAPARHVPLTIPAGMARRAVTDLTVRPETGGPVLKDSSAGRRTFGLLGHAVLEELAKNNWAGEIPQIVEQLNPEYGELETDGLTRQLEEARIVLKRETAGADALFPEHPFVLRQDDVILDGTMDLLVQGSGRWRILDYKFTREPPSVALRTYSSQLTVYKEAVERLHPDAEVSAALVLIGDGVRVMSMDAG